MRESVMYCPVCGRDITAINAQEVKSGEHDIYIFIHDDICHSDSDIEALEKGVQ